MNVEFLRRGYRPLNRWEPFVNFHIDQALMRWHVSECKYRGRTG